MDTREKDDENNLIQINRKGKYKWGDGSSYTGSWLDDKQHGIGIKKNKNNVQRGGEWKDGERIKWRGEVI